jgi:hypothetical protein
MRKVLALLVVFVFLVGCASPSQRVMTAPTRGQDSVAVARDQAECEQYAKSYENTGQSAAVGATVGTIAGAAIGIATGAILAAILNDRSGDLIAAGAAAGGLRGGLEGVGGGIESDVERVNQAYAVCMAARGYAASGRGVGTVVPTTVIVPPVPSAAQAGPVACPFGSYWNDAGCVSISSSAATQVPPPPSGRPPSPPPSVMAASTPATSDNRPQPVRVVSLTAPSPTQGAATTAARVPIVSPKTIWPALHEIGIALDSTWSPPRIARVDSGSHAASIGLLPGDMLLALDDKIIRSVDEVVAILRTKQYGETLAVMIDRDGQPQSFTATLLRSAEGTPPIPGKATRRPTIFR